MIGAVVTYVNNGSRRIGGQTVGADGRGTYAVLFEAETVESAESAAREYLKKLYAAREYLRHISEVHLVPAEEYFCGSAIQVINVDMPAGGTDAMDK